MSEADRLTLLAVLAFVLIAGIPPLLLLLYYLGVLRLPSLSAGIVSFAAVAGLFVLAGFFVAVLFAVAASRKKPVRYEWEAVFPARDEEFHEALAVTKAKRRHVVKEKYYIRQEPVEGKSPAVKVIAAAAIIALLVILFASSGSFSDLKHRFFGNQSNATEISVKTPSVKVEVTAAANSSSVFKNVRKIFVAAKDKMGGFASAAKRNVQKVPYKTWAIAASAALAILLIAVLFLSYRTGQLGQVQGWLVGWLDGAKSVLAAAWRKKLKTAAVLIAILLVAAGIAAFVFREKLGSSISPASAVHAMAAIRDFASVYRLYILVGVFALLVVIGILFLLEKRAGNLDGN